MLKQTFSEMCSRYTNGAALVTECWNEIETAYTHKKRFYHNLQHIESLVKQLNVLSSQFSNWDAVLFAVYYHDIVYNAIKQDNEEKSAELAMQRLKTLGVDERMINACEQLILATKKHEAGSNADINMFTDADLAILGADWETYQAYTAAIRKEYAVFPDIIYRPGRRKVLQHFLGMESIFKTPTFFDQFEKAAKQNLNKELALLS